MGTEGDGYGVRNGFGIDFFVFGFLRIRVGGR